MLTKKQQLGTILIGAFVGAVVGGVFSLVGTMDYEDEKLSEKNHCELVNLWEEDRANGIDPFERNGRPASSAEEKERCRKLVTHYQPSF